MRYLEALMVNNDKLKMLLLHLGRVTVTSQGVLLLHPGWVTFVPLCYTPGGLYLNK